SGTAATITGTVALPGVVNIMSDANLTLTGVVSGSGFNKTGGGALTLANGANSYTGQAIVNGGTLRIANAGALGTAASPTIVRGGSVLELSGALAAISEPILLLGNSNGSTGTLVS